MAKQESLMGVGLPAEAAKRLGFSFRDVAAVGTVQGSTVLRGGAGNLHANVTAADAANDSVTLGEVGFQFEPGDEVTLTATTTGIEVFPQVGGRINNLADNVAATVSVNNSRTFRKVTATRWWGLN